MAGKSVRSGKLPYSKPRTDINQPPMPSPATLVDRISYIRFWDKYNHGQPVDISKAKKMTRDGLLKADPRGIELMLAYSVPWRQIATQYNTPTGSLTSIFKRLGVNTKVESIVMPADEPEELVPETIEAAPLPAVPPAESPDDITYDPAQTVKFFEDTESIITSTAFDLTGFFTFDRTTVRTLNIEPLISVGRLGSVRLSRSVGETFNPEDRVAIKVDQAGKTIVLVPDPVNGLLFHKNKAGAGHRRLWTKSLSKFLIKTGIELPARYMASRQGDIWIGKLS